MSPFPELVWASNSMATSAGRARRNQIGWCRTLRATNSPFSMWKLPPVSRQVCAEIGAIERIVELLELVRDGVVTPTASGQRCGREHRHEHRRERSRPRSDGVHGIVHGRGR